MARKVEPDAIEYRTADCQAACPLLTASASARPARRGRRTWHVRTLSVREPGDLTAGQQRRSVCCTGSCREDRVLDRMSKNVAPQQPAPMQQDWRAACHHAKNVYLRVGHGFRPPRRD
jgi:hypothetical protein